MIENVDEFKRACNHYLDIAWATVIDPDEEKEVDELINIIDLINCDVIWELDGVRSFESEIDLNKIIDILSVGVKIKKLSEVNFDE